MIPQQKQKLDILLIFQDQEKFFGYICIIMEATVFYQFKAKLFEIKPHPLCLGNVSEHFLVNNM